MEQKQEAPEGLQAEAENFLIQPWMSFAMHILFPASDTAWSYPDCIISGVGDCSQTTTPDESCQHSQNVFMSIISANCNESLTRTV